MAAAPGHLNTACKIHLVSKCFCEGPGHGGVTVAACGSGVVFWGLVARYVEYSWTTWTFLCSQSLHFLDRICQGFMSEISTCHETTSRPSTQKSFTWRIEQATGEATAIIVPHIGLLRPLLFQGLPQLCPLLNIGAAKFFGRYHHPRTLPLEVQKAVQMPDPDPGSPQSYSLRFQYTGLSSYRYHFEEYFSDTMAV